VKRHAYRERDYAFAQLVLTLRTAIGLSQVGLAERLGASRRAVTDWEGGLSYPKAERLKQLIALGMLQHAFAAGREEQEIRALWKAAHQKVLLDEDWLQEVLRQPSSLTTLAGEPPAARGQDGAASSAELALWTVPYARNPHFSGRGDLLDQLRQQFAPSQADQPATLRRAVLTQAQVIKGLGGIGKTQTAIEYAYRAREQGRYTHTLWIAAGSEEALLASFAALAELLPGVAPGAESDQRKLVAAAGRWLEHCQQPWLLLVDNADDLSLVQPYLPLQGNGSVLLTTRASAAGWLASSLEVDAMGVLEGAELLLRRAGRFAGATDEEINEAANLVVALAQFPLALDQAGAYLEETGCSLADYRELYQSHRQVLLSRRGRQATGYPASVATTWSLSFEQVEQTNPAAAELLRLCAYLSPDHIPEELLTQGAPCWPPALQQAVANRFRFNQMLETLLAFSLVKRLLEHRLLSIHRLVQAVQLERMELQEQRQWAERVVRAVNAVFPHDPQEVDTWPACQRYLEQAQASDTLIGQYQLLLPEAAAVLDRTGLYLHERALYRLAEPLLRRALHMREQLLGETHPDVALSLQGLATLYWEQGKPDEAEPLFLRALGVWQAQPGSEPPLMAYSLHNLASLYWGQGKYAEAEPLFRRALRIWEEQLGPEHPDVAFGLWGLARISARQGRASQAEALFARALALRERHLGELHVRTAQVLHDFAGFQHGQGRAREAAVLYQRALTTRQRLLGPDHPLTRDTRQRLQEVLAALDQRQDAAPTERESGPRVSS